MCGLSGSRSHVGLCKSGGVRVFELFWTSQIFGRSYIQSSVCNTGYMAAGASEFRAADGKSASK